MNRLLLPVLMTSMLLCGCVEDITADDTSAFKVLQRGEFALSSDKQVQVISSQSNYDDIYYNLLNLNATPQTIDFSRYQVLLIMAGSSWRNVELNISSFSGLSDQVQIRWRTSYNQGGCPTSGVIRQPWLLVLFPKTDRPLVFSEQVDVKPC